MLTIQDHDTKKGSLHIWRRASGKLESVTGCSLERLHSTSDAWGVDVSASGHAVFFVEKTNSIEAWSPSWKKARVIQLPKLEVADPIGRTGPFAIGIASDGSRAAVLAFDAVYVVDLDSGAVTRVATPSPEGSVVAESVRGRLNARSWVRPLPHDQLLLIDSTRWGHANHDFTTSDRAEVVVSLYDVASGVRRAVCHAALFADVDYSLAEGIALGDDKVLLNRSRLIELYS